MISKILSGGQTGVDQAALDAAIDCGVEYGGWLPAGRKTESGPLPRKYMMDEIPSPSYSERTRKNVLAADATLIISHGDLSGGSALTQKIAVDNGLACFHLDLDESAAGAESETLKMWLQKNKPAILNIAGPRASSDTLVYKKSYEIIVELLRVYAKKSDYSDTCKVNR